jgi:hypothetical protein
MYWAKYNGDSWQNGFEVANGIWGTCRNEIIDKTGKAYFTSLHASLFGPKDGLYLNYYNGKLWKSHKIDYSGSQVNLFIDKDQILHRVWVKPGDSSNSDVWYALSEDSGKAWQFNRSLFSADGYSLYPMIVVDKRGVRHVVWLEDVNYNVFPDAIYYSSSLDGKTWTEKNIITGPYPYDFIWSKEICIDSQGTIHVFWSAGEVEDRRMYYSFGSGQIWSEGEQVFNPNYINLSGYFGLTIDRRDKLHIVYTSGKQVYYMSSESTTSNVQQKELANNLLTKFDLFQNYPNPFNPDTEIRFQLPVDVHVTFSIYNMLGQKVRTLIDKQMATGYHAIKWDGRNDFGTTVASGLYLYAIRAGNYYEVKKMVLMQ